MSTIRGMRGYLASSIAVTCAAALALPLTSPSSALADTARPANAERSVNADGSAAVARPAVFTKPEAVEVPGPASPETPAVPGSTRSLPLVPLSSDRSLGAASVQGLHRRDVPRFSLVGVVWDDPDTELRGTVQVRTRSAETGTWSAWQDVETHNLEHAADPESDERTSGRVRGSTAPLWVGESDGVEVRVQTKLHEHEGGHEGDGRAVTSQPLPSGLRLELVDPGEEPPPQGPELQAPNAVSLTAESAAASAVNADLAPLGATAIPELTRKQTQEDFLATRGIEAAEGAATNPYIGPRPRIVTRRGWGADESLRERHFSYTKSVRAAFVHHSASGNNYRCSQASSVIRSIYRYHVKSSGWRDIGYNFLVDKCGNIYEGRAGGVTKPVKGAHTLGFNSNSMGIAVLGSYNGTNPPSAAVQGVARLTAWKLGLYGANPAGKTYLKSGGGNLFRKGKNVRLNVISGHRDGFATECPGARLYAKLHQARTTSARFQGR
ncbi:peptidoglycan recognition protein family protein [Streptomyces sp. CA-288835]|uniref:peptidoglycan recognition protein family protein n=1 Tax=Streptomyces sp. CA-288835 TaxID=3240069 RepID=UPI003D92C712